MKTPECITIDFETAGIQRRPDYPPKPAGVSIKKPGDRKATHYAWGYPTENNCSKRDGQRALADAYKSRYGLLFQFAKFDTEVAEVHMDLPLPPWERIHDTLYLIFLYDPHAESYSLKPSAERILGMKPEERDAVRDWVIANVPEAKRKKSEWGAYISRAPGRLVGHYANGDVIRTERLFKHLWPIIVERGMKDAYDRERHLMPIMLANERMGIRMDAAGLERDYSMYQQALGTADNWLRKRLKTDISIDQDKEFGDALARNKVVTKFNYTAPTKNHPNGQRSVSKKNLTLDMFNDKQVAHVYGYRNRLTTCLNTFLEPWLFQARETGGRIHTNWNQVRQDRGGDTAGARTGRLSSNPNFQNIPKDFEKKGDGFTHPKFLRSLPMLPLMRKYLLPDSAKDVWGHRDYSQQELRILAHFEDGALLAAYLANPKLDVHGLVHDGILEMLGLDLIRDDTKRFVFRKVYGGGIPGAAEALRTDATTAKKVISAMMEILPDYATLEKEVQNTGKAGQAIHTWGGREYYTEPPKFVKKFNRHMTFEYKLLNYLIQGSAADCTKEALIRYHEHPKRQSRFLVTVHDEINCSMPKKTFAREMEILRECMQSVEFALPMLSEGKSGPCWGDLKKLES